MAHEPADRRDQRPILFAYDGSEHSKASLREAARQLGPGRDGIVLTVWEPMAVLAFGGVGDGTTEVEGQSEGAHGRTGLSYVLLGSVSSAVARHSERPVLIVHPRG